MIWNKEKEAKKEAEKRARRDDYIKIVLGDQGKSLIVEDSANQKMLFLQELERLAGLVADVSISTAVTGDCNKLLDDANNLINTASQDKCAIIGKFDKVKQRLIRAYDSREDHPLFFGLITLWNLSLLFLFVYCIVVYTLVPGQSRLENTAFVCLACAIWGGIGGIVDAFLAMHTHIAKQDFDRQYMPWYYLHPFLGLSMGAVVYLILQAGLLAVSGVPLQEAATANATAISSEGTVLNKIGVTALPIALAFLAGFRQRTAVDFFTRIITSIFSSSNGGNREE